MTKLTGCVSKETLFTSAQAIWQKTFLEMWEKTPFLNPLIPELYNTPDNQRKLKEWRKGEQSSND